MATPTFQEVLTAAVADLAEHGYDSVERVDAWTERLRVAAAANYTPQWRVDEMLRSSLGSIYRTMVERGGLLKYHPGVSRFTLQRLTPNMRRELDRRILMSANLIKLNREDALATTLRRFSGWASSIPAGGSDVVDKVDVKQDVKKALASLSFVERRVAIDQGHKLKAALNDVVAKDSGALAMIWHSHYRQAGYNFREDHKERDEHCYAIRGNWAIEKGLMKAGPDGYTDEITAPAEEVFCRCYGTYIYSLRKLPPNMLTAKGVSELTRTKVA